MTGQRVYPYGGSLGNPEIELWTMELIKALDLATSTGMRVVGEFLPEVKEEVQADVTGQYKILWHSMETYGQVVPIYITKNLMRLRDGIHRIALADLHGWKWMTVSSTRITWSQWHGFGQGQEYDKLWSERIQGLHGVR